MSDPIRERLYSLLPEIHRVRDAAQGEPLRALLALLDGEVQAVEDDISHLYENWFIETCDEWVVPYIADLLRVRGLQAIPATAYSQRAYVANTLSYRRRKGTVGVLADVARDATGWPARAVEFSPLIGRTQHLSAPTPASLRTPNLRQRGALDQPGGAFEGVAHVVDVRQKFNLPHVGLFLWRLLALPARQVRAAAVDRDQGRYTFSPLGQDQALFNPHRDATATAAADSETVLPGPLRTQGLAAGTVPLGDPQILQITLVGANPPLIAPEKIAFCDLGTWHPPSSGASVAVDAERGRLMVLGTGPQPAKVLVSYWYGSAAEFGGGFYNRQASLAALGAVDSPTLASDPAAPAENTAADLQGWLDAKVQAAPNTRSFRLEISDSETFRVERLTIPAHTQLAICAANEQRPLLLSDPLRWEIFLGEGATLVLNGLLISAALRIMAPPTATVLLQHCTLVPGIALNPDGAPRMPGVPSIRVSSLGVPALGLPLLPLPLPLLPAAGTPPSSPFNLTLERCISGPIVIEPQVRGALSAVDSVIDAAGATDVAAIQADILTLVSSTVLGHTKARSADLISDTICDGALLVASTQSGCMRFSYTSADTSAPPRYRCVPDVSSGDVWPSDGARVAFTSTRYGQPGYAQLSRNCPPSIRQGGSDQSEMGAFHALYQPQREATLRVGLLDYLRVGLTADIFFVT